MTSTGADLPAAFGPGAKGVRRALVLLPVLAAMLAVVLALAWVAGRIAEGRAAGEIAGRAEAAAPLAAAPLVAVIEKQRLIPMVLSRDPEVIALLAAPGDASRDLLAAKLAAIAEEAASSVIYIVARDGVAIAASNDNTPGSFVGSDYGFRTYFRRAMAEGAAQQYALGTVSGRPGLYLARRVDGASGPLGVVVVKVEFDALEARWRQSGLVVVVTDADGVVLATTEPAWRFGTTRPLADEAATRTALQLGDRPMPAVPIDVGGPDRARIGARIGDRLYITAAEAIGPSAPGWRLATFLPAEPALARAARNAQITALLAGAVVALAGFGIRRRRRWALARQAALAAMNAELERRVALRTDELDRSNTALAAEIAEREAAETRARRLRDDLAQANRLSTLGQITAGIAHEINQPLAAIRAYAETGVRLIDAGQPGEARGNLGEIVGVADRIGTITRTLRGFSRRATGEIGPVRVDEALDGALALLAGPIRDAGATIVRAPRAPGVAVVAGRIRLEQILVNLLQNALDAMRDTAEPRIAIRIDAAPETVPATAVEMVRVSVTDNGPGIPAEVRDQLFMPFTTTKATGLGLGLVISADLAREFGGTLTLEPPEEHGRERGGERGASFTLELRRAG